MSGENTLSPELKERINNLLLAHGDKSEYDSMGNLGRFLSQPVHGSSFKGLRDTSEKQTSYKYVNIIITLLRLFLR